MRNHRLDCACIALAAMLVVVPPVRGQTAGENDWRQGTTLAGFIGAASPSGSTDAAWGASIGWEVTPRFGIDARGTWLGANRDASAFAAAIGAHLALDSERPMVPFVSAGAGLYRAMFEAPLSRVPAFYRRRIVAGSDLVSRTFDDFAVVFGGGAEVFLSRHVALRPELTVLLVTTRSDVRAVPVYGIHLGYHFEEHPITPAPTWSGGRTVR